MGGCKWESVREIGPPTSNNGSNNDGFISVYSTPNYAADDTKMMAIRPPMPPPLSPLPDTNIDPYRLPQAQITPILRSSPIVDMGDHGYQARFPP